MMITNSQVDILQQYKHALSLFKAGQFARAHQAIRIYRQGIKYDTFNIYDNRIKSKTVVASVIIVTRNRKRGLLDCLKSIENQPEPPFEIIVVDNGSDHSLKNILTEKKLLLVTCPIPFTPSEGRNIGSHFSKSELLIFLDDDAFAGTGFVESVVKAFDFYDFLGIRGKILPKTTDVNDSLAGVYDMGEFPFPALLDVEGNIAVPKKYFSAVQGMNSLLFGGEGLDLTARLIKCFPEGEVFYWPQMVIKHDYVSGDKLLAKRKRQALVNEYFTVLQPFVLEIKKHYAEIYRTYFKRTKNLNIRSLASKINNRSKNLILSLKSEKNPYQQSTQSNPNIAISPKENYANKKNQVNNMERQMPLKMAYELEVELERTRRSFDFKIGSLITGALNSPIDHGLMFPVRLARLVKDYFRQKR